jgi:hypothetical protein
LLLQIVYGLSHPPKGNSMCPSDCVKHVSLNQIYKRQEPLILIRKLYDWPKKSFSGSREIVTTQHPRPKRGLWNAKVMGSLIYPVSRHLA